MNTVYVEFVGLVPCYESKIMPVGWRIGAEWCGYNEDHKANIYFKVCDNGRRDYFAVKERTK